MNADTYSVHVVWSEEDQAFVASVFELAGCMAHGETRVKAIEQIGIAIENWLETARAIGRETPPPKHLAEYERQVDQSAEERLKQLEAQIPEVLEAALPAISRALAIEIAKSGEDVLMFSSAQGGLRLVRRAHVKNSPQNVKRWVRQSHEKKAASRGEGGKNQGRTGR